MTRFEVLHVEIGAKIKQKRSVATHRKKNYIATCIMHQACAFKICIGFNMSSCGKAYMGINDSSSSVK